MATLTGPTMELFMKSSNQTIKAVLVNDTDGRVNIGCRLTSVPLKKSLICAFRKYNCHLIIDSVPYLFSNRKRRISRIWRKKESGLLSYFPWGFKDPFTAWLECLAHAEYGKGPTNLTLAADYVFFQPEGTLSDDSDFNKVAGFLSLPILAILAGKKVICLNGTIPEYTGAIHDLVSYLFENCFYAAARDRVSARLYGCDFIPDAAFAYQATSSSKHDRKKLLITTGARNTADKDLFIIDHALKYAEKSGLRPFVLTKGIKRFTSRKEFIKSMGGEFLETATLEDTEKKLKDCALHIGGRYHMAIFALKFGIPSLLYDIKTHKNIWLSQEFQEVDIFDTSFDIFASAENLYDEARFKQWGVSDRVKALEEQYHYAIDELACKIITSSFLQVKKLYGG
mgnify:CR=1 FL=1